MTSPGSLRKARTSTAPMPPVSSSLVTPWGVSVPPPSSPPTPGGPRITVAGAVISDFPLPGCGGSACPFFANGCLRRDVTRKCACAGFLVLPWRISCQVALLRLTGCMCSGHGCLVFATKMADAALGAACAAGWIRFDHYQTEWQGVSSSFAGVMPFICRPPHPLWNASQRYPSAHVGIDGIRMRKCIPHEPTP